MMDDSSKDNENPAFAGNVESENDDANQNLGIAAVTPERFQFIGQDNPQSGLNVKSYTAIVRVLKLALPIVAVAIIAVIFTWPNMQTPDLPEPGEELITANIEKNELIKPRFESQDSQNQPYTITADKAVQNVRNPDLVNLEKPMADMHMKSGAWLAIEANEGQYRQNAESLLLEGQVRVFHDEGYEMTSERLSINLKSRRAYSDQPVSGHGPEGKIDATGIQVDNERQSIIFTGPAKLVLYDTVEGLNP